MLYFIEPYKRDSIIEGRLGRGIHWCQLNAESWVAGKVKAVDVNYVRNKNGKYRIYSCDLRELYV